jgi:hypothetical protein
MLQHRKSAKRILFAALRKCSKFYKDGVHAYCTPVEHVILCAYFETETWDLKYSLEEVKKGVSRLGTHYMHVKKWSDYEFPVHRYASLHYNMSQPY